MDNPSQKIRTVAILGPTATGKTTLAVALAKAFDGEILSVDSRQIYHGLDIGSGKDLAEYGNIPYSLIDIADPACEFCDLARFLTEASQALRRVTTAGKLPILCGGTPLYMDALLRRYKLSGPPPSAALRAEWESFSAEQLREKLASVDPETLAHCHEKNSIPRLRRLLEKALAPGTSQNLPALDALVMGVYYPRETVRQRIELRLDARLNSGMVEEVSVLHDAGVAWETLERFGLEYREIALYLQRKQDFPTMRRTLLNRIRQFAKRQDIFFRKMERAGVKIHWLRSYDKCAEATSLVRRFQAGEAMPEPDFRLADFASRKEEPFEE